MEPLLEEFSLFGGFYGLCGVVPLRIPFPAEVESVLGRFGCHMRRWNNGLVTSGES